MTLVALAILGAAPAAAQPFGARPGGEAQVQSLDRILNNIRRTRPGTLSDVEGPFGPSTAPRYRIKWLTPDGRILWLDTDARTGQILRVEGDDQPRGGGNFVGPRRQDLGPQNFPPPGFAVPRGPGFDRRGRGYETVPGEDVGRNPRAPGRRFPGGR